MMLSSSSSDRSSSVVSQLSLKGKVAIGKKKFKWVTHHKNLYIVGVLIMCHNYTKKNSYGRSQRVRV